MFYLSFYVYLRLSPFYVSFTVATTAPLFDHVEKIIIYNAR